MLDIAHSLKRVWNTQKWWDACEKFTKTIEREFDAVRVTVKEKQRKKYPPPGFIRHTEIQTIEFNEEWIELVVELNGKRTVVKQNCRYTPQYKVYTRTVEN